MTKLSIKAKNTLLQDAEQLGFDIAKADEHSNLKFLEAIRMLKAHPDDNAFRASIEEKFRLGRMRFYLSKKNPDITPEETLKIRNLSEKDRTPAEHQAYEAANQWILRKVRRAYNLAKSDTRGRKEGSTNKPKTATANPKAGSTMTPAVKGKEEYVKYMKGMAAYLQAFYEKNKDIADCDAEKALLLAYVRGCAILK